LAYVRQEESTAAYQVFFATDNYEVDIYRRTPYGEMQNLTPGEGNVSYQGLSNDGQWVVYQGPNSIDLYRAHIDGSRSERLTYFEDASTTDNAAFDMGGIPSFIGSADDWFVGQFRTRIFGIKDGQFKWLTPPNADVEGIGISTDGKYVVYTDYTQNIVQLYRMNPDGTDAIGITPTTETFQFGTWSREGLYAYSYSDSGARVYHVKLNEFEPELLLDASGWDQWLGVREYWTYFSKGNDLYRQNIESREEQLVAQVDIGDLYTITFTEEWLYYATFDSDLHEARLFRMRPDGTERSEILDTQASVASLVASPDLKYAILIGSTESYAFKGDKRWKLPVDSGYEFAGWTPDGMEIILNPVQVACPCNVMTMNPDGTNRQFITDFTRESSFLESAPLISRAWQPGFHTALGVLALGMSVIWWRIASQRS
jgi:hypothetical protein